MRFEISDGVHGWGELVPSATRVRPQLCFGDQPGPQIRDLTYVIAHWYDAEAGTVKKSIMVAGGRRPTCPRFRCPYALRARAKINLATCKICIAGRGVACYAPPKARLPTCKGYSATDSYNWRVLYRLRENLIGRETITTHSILRIQQQLFHGRGNVIGKKADLLLEAPI